jgi:fructose-specific phosphotransferase system IIA component
MDINKLTNENLVNLNLKGNTKKEVLKEMIKLFEKENRIISAEEFYQTILAREEEGTTGLGRGIAIPHGKSETVKELTLAVGRTNQGIDYNSLDAKPVHLIFMVADYQGYSPGYLKMVSKLVSKLRIDEYRESLMNAESETEVIEIIQQL